MTISGNYPSPVFVNGYACLNCADVSRAQKNIDPADATGGAFDAKAGKVEASAKAEKLFDRDRIDATLAAAREADDRSRQQAHAITYGAPTAVPTGQLLDLRA